MNNLSERERTLVSIGSAIASNCLACIVYHIKKSRNIGLTDEQIKEALFLAEKVKKVPAQGVLNKALANLNIPSDLSSENGDCELPDCECQA